MHASGSRNPVAPAWKRLAAIALLALFAGAAHAQGASCSSAQSQEAEKALDRVVNWDLMYAAWKQYGHCDTIMTEDLFTDALMRLIVEWKHVDQFAAKYQGDKQFKEFVNRHFRSLGAKEDVKSVYSRAKSNCPPRMDAFCAELAEAAKSQ